MRKKREVKIRINIFAHRISPSLGGIESTAWHLGKEFHKYAETVLVASECAGIKGCFFIKISENPVKMAVQSVFMKRRLLPENRMVINFCMQYQAAFGAYLMYRMFHVPYLVLTHGNEMYRKENPSSIKALKQAVRKEILDHALAVCTNSMFTKQMTEKVTVNKVTVVHPGVDYQETGEVQEEKYNILSIGRLVRRKGFQDVLKALPAVLECYPVEYHVAGAGPMEAELKALAKRLGISSHVIFHGRVSEQKKDELLRKCQVFIMTAKEIPEEYSVEGFGVVYMEAAMYGKYVIASDSGGCRDAVKDGITGCMIHSSEPAQIAEALCEFFEKRYQDFSSDLAKKWAEEHSYQKAAIQYMEIIKKAWEKQTGTILY